MLCLRRMDLLKTRLAEADGQYIDLAEQLENAREQWLMEKDAASKADLKIVYKDILSMVNRASTRVMQLEAGLSENGEFTSTGNACTFRSVQA